MKVTVYHRETIDPRQEQAGFDAVAIVDAGSMTVNQALEYAYRATNNINGSWSKGSTVELNDGTHVVNNDFDPNVEFVGEFPVGKDGTVYGARSTSVMDMMAVDGQMYEVAGMGFKKVHNTGIKIPA